MMSHWSNSPNLSDAPCEEPGDQDDSLDVTSSHRDRTTSLSMSEPTDQQPAPANRHSFRVRLDVRQFEPHEISIEHGGGLISVHGKHEERTSEHGFISREFTRKYEIPQDVDPEKVTCSWHSDNVLVIKAPRNSAIEGERNENLLSLPHSFADTLHHDI